jgi:cytochrome c oxidase subunit IV
MAHLSYEESKSRVLRIILFLAAVTLIEVTLAMLGKGYIIKGLELPFALMAGLMIVLSIIKAVYIVFEFMHMRYEVPALMKTVLVPGVLLIWGVIAFMWEGSKWKDRRMDEAARSEYVAPPVLDEDHPGDEEVKHIKEH